jgi:hypothetical protein
MVDIDVFRVSCLLRLFFGFWGGVGCVSRAFLGELVRVWIVGPVACGTVVCG